MCGGLKHLQAKCLTNKLVIAINITRTCWPGDACKGTKKINIKRRNKNRRDTASNLRAMLGKWEGPRAWSKYQTSTNDKSKRKGTVCTPVKPAKPVGRRFKTIRTIVCSRLVFPFSVSLSLSLFIFIFLSFSLYLRLCISLSLCLGISLVLCVFRSFFLYCIYSCLYSNISCLFIHFFTH